MSEEANTTQDPRAEKTFKDLQQELIDREFIGAETLTTKAQALAILTALDKKESAVPAVQPEQPQTVLVGNVRDDENKDKKKYFGKAKAMKDFLDTLPVVDFIIPLEIGEKRGAVATWQANGYRLNMLKGVRIKIPSKVADDLAESYNLTSIAGEEFSLDREKHVGGSPYKTVGEALE